MKIVSFAFKKSPKSTLPKSRLSQTTFFLTSFYQKYHSTKPTSTWLLCKRWTTREATSCTFTEVDTQTSNISITTGSRILKNSIMDLKTCMQSVITNSFLTILPVIHNCRGDRFVIKLKPIIKKLLEMATTFSKREVLWVHSGSKECKLSLMLTTKI